MENITFQDLEKWELLLKSKDFGRLSPEEKQWVLSLVSEREYTAMAAFYSVADKKSPSPELEPPSSIKEKLDRSLETEKNNAPPVYRKKIPLYQSAAAAIVFFLLGYFVNLFAFKPDNSEKIAQTIVRDTIRVIQYVKDSATALPANFIQTYPLAYIAEKTHIANDDSATLKTTGNNAESILKNLAENTLKHALREKNGQSLAEDTILRRMLVVIN